MSSPRVRRLESDHQKIMSRFAAWPRIEIILADGQPPDRYQIQYNIKGLDVSADGQRPGKERNMHILDIFLGLEYPRRAPQLKLLTPIFHPNFINRDVCAQDIYAASEGLDDLIVRVGRMIAYQEYNIRSPLNALAAQWAAENSPKLPLDAREVSPTSEGSSVSGSIEAEPATEPWEDQIKIGGQVEAYSATASNDPVDCKCPECQLLFRSPAEQVGEIVQCPSCNASFMVAVSVDQEADRNAVQRYRCPHCAQLIEADASMEGSEVGCPSCQGVIILGG
jgi:ubiquitin-protein ligase/DNA-directed RNA polymerase subunit RPC12/RpoP